MTAYALYNGSGTYSGTCSSSGTIHVSGDQDRTFNLSVGIYENTSNNVATGNFSLPTFR